MKEELLKNIIDYVNQYSEGNGGTSPSVREIAAVTGVSRSTVSNYLIYMKKQGILQYNGTRSIITPQKQRNTFTNVDVPVVGNIACGQPRYAEENIEEYVSLPSSITGSKDVFILRAKGDSMIHAGIRDGDLVLIRQQETAQYNQIVAALIDDETTLKRFRPQPDYIILHPENPDFDDIVVNECVIQGVAIGVYHYL